VHELGRDVVGQLRTLLARRCCSLTLIHADQTTGHHRAGDIRDVHHIASRESATNLHNARMQKRYTPVDESRSCAVVDRDSAGGLCRKGNPQLSCGQAAIVSQKGGANTRCTRHRIM